MAYNNNRQYNKNTWSKSGDKSSYRSSRTDKNPSSSILHHSSKRGKLSVLMSEEQKSNGNVQDLSYDFSCRIIRLYQYLTDPISDERLLINDEKNDHSSSIINPSSVHEREYILSKQILRSGTSVGANVREAQHAQSDADFLSKMSIAYKEADETSYWLNLFHDNGYLSDDAFRSVINDNDRLLRLLSSIVKSTKQKIENAKKK